MFFFIIKSIDSEIKGILNLGWISSLYFNKKYLTASIPKVCDMFLYRPTVLPCMSTYSPNNPNVFPKVRELYGNLQTSKILGKIFAKQILTDCKRQPSNLKRLLCSSNL